ncbi:MAG: NUDIX hydrolase [Candidatus Nomurabacteria bacterium]|nr:MAG: NUDIX hydrolase [Candidatus Nomurabacteria bacterium]
MAGLVVSPFAVIGLRLYTKVTRRPRVRVLVTNEKDEVLLLRGVIAKGRRWSLPGGGVNRRESLPAAAQRELYEETGIDVATSKLRHLRTVPRAELNLPFDAPVFHVKVKRADLPDTPHNPREIAHVAWFRTDDLPKHVSALALEIIAKYHT